MAELGSLFVSVLVITISQLVSGNLVRINHGVSVSIGRTVKLDKTMLAFTRVNMMDTCKVEVINNEPITQRVGQFEPQVFDCDYFPGSLRYTHSGAPFLTKDQVKLSVFHLTSTSTFQETFVVNITIRNDSYQIFQPKQHLIVSDFNGFSNIIDSSIMAFNYSKSVGSFCVIHVRTMTRQLPAFGQLISQQSGNPEIIRTMSVECDDFIQLGIRYEHLIPPTPNIDFVALTVEVSDPNSSDEPIEESYYLPVDIEAAFPNQPPTALHMSMYLLEVDQFILTTIAPSILSAKDDETSKGELVFEVVNKLNMSEGCIVHLNDQSQSIMSFTQYDVQMLNIAYKPPNTSFPERRNFKMNFIVYDSYFATSKPINLMFSVRNSITNAPRIMINRGLSLLEGQSRIISSDHLQIVDNDNIDRVRIKVMGGLMHGKLYKGDSIVVMFTPADVVNGLIIYRHDDSDSETDSIELRVSDVRHSVHATFPINILPKDDTAPYLIRNVQFSVKEGAVLRITKDLLLASDVDSPNDFILFKIMVPPTAGEILKRFSPKAFGYPVNEFTQRDLHHGRIYYSHLGEEIFEDFFDFVLLDNQIPPNMSPRQQVMVKIEPIDDLPPYLVFGTTLEISVLETEIGVLTQQNICYTDAESPDEELLYAITTPPHFADTYSLTDAGRIISTSGMAVPSKDPEHQAVISFTQEEIDHLRVAYMPPFKEIGPHARTVQLIYSVHDKHGNAVLGQVFNITILPVNNQPPEILCNDIMVREGDSTIITHLMLAVTDMDTEVNQVTLQVIVPPNYGNLQLNGVNLEGNRKSFSMQDIKQQRLRYVHDGSETLRDSIKLIANDGSHTTTKVIPVIIAPVNDGVPQILPGLITELSLPERGEISLSTDVLSATDVDTHDLLLKYIIISPPSAGVILKNGNAVNKFTQMDIRDGLIKYKHTSGEIGRNTLEDTVTFVISDKIVPSVETLPLLDIHFSITPVDNQPPAIVLGNPYFVDEGQRATINSNSLSAIDRDTLPQDITFIITQIPHWGFIENELPDIGSEKSNAGKAITSFTMQDISMGNINYVQSHHEGNEPTTDFFMVFATDGQRISANVSFPVTIVAQNDEIPTLSITNFTLYEGSFFKLSPSFFFATDADIPMEMLMFSITKAPRHGIIIDREETNLRTALEEGSPIYDFNLNQLMNTLKLTYVHDDSESTSDEFILRVTDGKHVVKKTTYITIYPVNDQYPALMKNSGIVVDMHDTRTLSSVVLLAYDADTPDAQLYYVITSVPRRGQLQVLDISDNWKVVQPNENFTQHDLNMNHVRYQHVGSLGSKGFDRIRFFVTDGEFSTDKESFRIEITNTKKQALEIFNNGASVQEGDFIVISGNLLSADDGSNLMDEIIFTINTPPSDGQIEFLSQPGQPIITFTQVDLTGGRIIYLHKQMHQVSNDQFNFMVSNGQQSKNDTFYIVVEDVDNELPELVLLQPVTMADHGTVIIASNYLQSNDDDTPANSIIYTITQPPLYGQLLIGDLPVRSFFTQADIDNLKISYKHIRGRPDMDEFFFIISDGTNIGYKINNQVLYQPQRFAIEIISTDDVAPHVTTMQVPINLERKNGFYGYVINKGHLEVVDEESSPSEVAYTIVVEPVYGHLENTKTRRSISNGFTQQDINELNIVFVLKENTRATNDSFTFDVQDGSRNQLTNQRFEFKWAIIQFAQADVLVCETVGRLPVHVIRSGYITQSSFIQISVQEIGANVGLDFIASATKLIQFDPGVTLATWSVEIIQDNIEENRERVRLILREPVNAIVGEYQRQTIIIKDATNGVCNGESDGSIVTSHQQVRPFGPSGISTPDCINADCDGLPQPGTSGCLNGCDGPGGCDGGCIGDPDGILPDNAEGCISGCLDPEDIPHNAGQGTLKFVGPNGESLHSKIQIPGYQVSRQGQQSSGMAGPGIIPKEYLIEGNIQQGRGCGGQRDGCSDGDCVGGAGTCSGSCSCGDTPQEIPFPRGQSSGPIEIPLLYPSAGNSTNPNIDGEQGTEPRSERQREGKSDSDNKEKKRGKKKKDREESTWKTVFTSLRPASSGDNGEDQQERVTEVHKSSFRSHAVPVDPLSNDTQTIWTFHGIGGRESTLAETQEGVHSETADGDAQGRFPEQKGKSSSGSLLGLLQRLQQDSPEASASPQPTVQRACTQANIGELYINGSSSKVYECDGETWIDWQLSQEDDTFNQGCENGWSRYNEKCYYLSDNKKTWNEAQRTCREHFNGNLITITSKEHQKWIQSLLSGHDIWIGLNDKFMDGRWEWVSQEPKMFTRWKNNEPESNKKKNCACLSSRMRWVARACNKLTSRFICEN